MEAGPKLTLDKDTFDLAVKEGEAKLARLNKKRARARLYADAEGIAVAEREIATVQAQLEALDKQKAEIEIGIDHSAFDRFRTALAAGGVGGGRGGSDGRGLLAFLGGSGGSGRLVSALGEHSLPALAAAAFVAEGALAALAAAAIGLGAALAPLAGLLAVIPPAIAGLGQVGGSLFATFSGIKDAVKASGDATTKAAADDTAALEQQRSATEAVRGAKLALAGAQRQAGDAQEALTLARKDATRTLEDMKDKAMDTAIAEQGSVTALKRAREELNRVVADPKSSQLDIEEARNGITAARQVAKEARQEAKRAKADSDAAQRGGVDKTPQVVSARKQLAEANRSVTESTRALARAQEQAAAGTNKLSSSQQKLREEMGKLSPAGREFVRFLVSLKPAFRSIRNASQEAALPHFQKGIQGAMKNLPTFRQQLTNTSRVLGVATKNVGKFIGSKGFGKDFQIITRANNNVLRNFGRAMIPLGKAFNDVSVAAAPFTRWIGRAVLHLARLTAHSAKAGRESGGLAAFFRRTRTVLEELGKTTGNLVRALGGLFKASFPAGRGFLELLTRITGKFDDWANSAKGQNSIKKFMEDAKGPLKSLGDALVSVLRLMLDLMKAPGSGEGFKLFARSIKLFADALDFLARIPLVGGVVANVALLAVVAGRFGRLGAAITGLKELAGGIRGVTAAEAASGGGLRGFGQRIRAMLSGLAKTRVGETIASNISAGLGLGAIKFRRALDGLKGMMRRILGSAGIGAGTSAAEGATGAFASRGRWRRAATTIRGFGFWGGLGLGIGAAIAIPAAEDFISKFKQRLKEGGITEAIEGIGRDAAGGAQSKYGTSTSDTPFDRILGRFKTMEAFRGTLAKELARAKKGDKDAQASLRRLGSGTFEGTEVPDLKAAKALARRTYGYYRDALDAEGRKAERKKGKGKGTTAPARTKTVEIQTPILSLKAKDVEKSMGRIQVVLRRELGEARRLIERQVGHWDDVFRGFRLLKGDDPLHLGSGVRRSLEDGRKAVRGIVNSLGRVLERLSVLFRQEGFEAGAQLGRGLASGVSPAVRAAERIRLGVTAEFGKMKRQSSVEARDMVSNLRATFSRLPEVVSRSTGEMLKIVLTAMKALGATGQHRISSAVDKIEGKAQGGFIKKAQGGYIPGTGLQDTVPLHLPPGAVVETRHQIPVIDTALRMYERLRYAAGGLVPVIAAPGERVRLPGEVPRVQRALALTAAQGLQPFGSLEQVFGTIQRPHYAAKGGRVASTTQTVARQFVGEAPAPPTITQKVVQRFAKGGQVEGIVPIPGQPGESIHSSIVKQVTSLVRRYKLRVTDGYAPSGHAAGGEHPKGLAIDVVPGKGGSWDLVDKLAARAEPTQGSPRAPFRWVGYTGDAGHGRGNHLHLSWGGRGGGEALAVAPRIRVRVKGAAGALRDMTEGGVRQVRKAANRKLSRAEGPTASGAIGKGGPLGKPSANMKLGRQLMSRKFSPKEWPALRTLWQGESGWKTTADNPTSDAYGIPQALPGHKMRSAGRDWETNPATQIKWGLGYIKQRYGTPGKALAAWRGRSPHWYAKGGFVGRMVQALARGGVVRRKALARLDPALSPRASIRERSNRLRFLPPCASSLTEPGDQEGHYLFDLPALSDLPLPLTSPTAFARGGRVMRPNWPDSHDLREASNNVFIRGRKPEADGATVRGNRNRPLPFEEPSGPGDGFSVHPASILRFGPDTLLQSQAPSGRSQGPVSSKGLGGLSAPRFARGGVVGRIKAGIQAFAPGGFVAAEKQPRGTKKPRVSSSRRHEQRPGGGWLTRRPRRRLRVPKGPEFPAALIDQFQGLWEGELAEGSPLLEDYSIAIDDAGLTDEVFLVDSPGSGPQTVDWSAVRIRISELTGLQQKAGVIRDKIVAARDLALDIIKKLKATIETQARKLAAIYKKLTDNITRLKTLNERRNRKDKHLKREKDKTKKDWPLIHDLADEIDSIDGQIHTIRKENVDLGGLPESMPLTATEDDKDSKLGKIWDISRQITLNLNPSEEGIAGSLIEIQGSTGRGGRLRDINKEINAYTSELGDLQPGGKLVTIQGAGGEAGTNAAAEIKSFLASIGDLFKQYGSNIQPFKLQRGGIIPGLGPGDKIPVLAEPGEGFINKRAVQAMGGPSAIEHINKLVPRFQSGGVVRPLVNDVTVDPRTGELKVKVELEKDKDEKPQVTFAPTINYAAPEPEPHSLTHTMLHEVKASV